MASNMGGNGKESKRARRSSILDPVVQREGVLDSTKFKELVPPSVVINAGRHSQTLSRRSSSNFPPFQTPLDPQKKKMTKINELPPRCSSIPRIKPNSSRRATELPLHVPNLTAINNETPSTSKGFSIRGSQASSGSTRMGILKKSTGPAGPSQLSRSTIRRSVSSESLLFSGTTPLPSRTMSVGRGKSPGLSRNWSSQESLTTLNTGITKSLKPPKPNDKKSHAPIVSYIISFLRERKYGKEFTVVSFGQITVNEFYSICKYICSFVLGSTFFGPKDDSIAKIMEAAILLKYPLQLTKNQLKSPTIAGSWPAVITFLAWLCCRIETIDEPTTKNEFIPRREQYVGECLLKSLKNLFFETVAPTRSFEEALEVEYNEFKKEIAGEFIPPTEMNLEEMKTILKEKKEKLEELNQIADPRQEILDKIKDTKEKAEASRQRKAEILEQIRRLTDKTGQISRRNLLEKKIQAVATEVGYYKNKLSVQVMTSEEAKRMQEEALKIKRECDSVEELIHSLENRYQNKQTVLKNHLSRYAAIFKDFAVVEEYNDKVRQLNFKHVIPVNPYNVKELKTWLPKAKKNLLSCMKNIEEMKTQISLEREKFDRVQRKGKEVFDQKNEELRQIQQSIQQFQQDFSIKMEQIQFEHDEFDSDLSQAEKQLETLKTEVELDKQEQEKLMQEKIEAQKKLEEAEKVEREWRLLRDKQFVESLKARGEEFYLERLMELYVLVHQRDLGIAAAEAASGVVEGAVKNEREEPPNE